jgi:hypothetical protein
MPKIFALRAVHRQTAASRSTKPPSREQQELVGTLPIFTPLIKPSTLAQTPSFSASTGHLPDDDEPPDGDGGGQLLFGGGGGGGGVGHFALARTKKRRLTARKSAALDAIVNSLNKNNVVWVIRVFYWVRMKVCYLCCFIENWEWVMTRTCHVKKGLDERSTAGKACRFFVYTVPSIDLISF